MLCIKPSEKEEATMKNKVTAIQHTFQSMLIM